MFTPELNTDFDVCTIVINLGSKKNTFRFDPLFLSIGFC